MMTMSAFVEADGMSMLQHADKVQISQVTKDMSTEDQKYFVDIRFHFNSMKNTTFFGEQDIVKENHETVDTNGFLPPKKTVSILSDDNGPVSTEVEVINNRNGNDHLSPISERYTNEILQDGNKAAYKLQTETLQEAVFMPDEMWIRRTQTISSILKKRASEDGAAEEDTTANVASVRGIVPAVVSRDQSDSSAECGEPPIDYEFTVVSPSTQPTTDMATSNENKGTELNEITPEPHHVSGDREHGLKEILNHPKAISKLDEKLFERITEKKVHKDDNKPDDVATRATNANNSASCSEVKREEDQQGNDEDERQPNPNLQGVKKAHTLQENPEPNTVEGENEQAQTAVNRVKQTAGGLLKRSSILAKNLFGKISSTDAKTTKRQSAGLDENAPTNDDQNIARGLRSLLRKLSWGAETTAQNGTTAPEGSTDAKAAKRQSPDVDEKAATNDGQTEARGIRSLLRKFSSAAEMTTQPETKAPEDEAKPEGEPSKFGKRRSLIFDRR